MVNFVEAMATSMMTRIGILASRVNKPIKIRIPQSISKAPTNAPRNSGAGSPIVANRPPPLTAGNKHF